jgi:hypothetical protein
VVRFLFLIICFLGIACSWASECTIRQLPHYPKVEFNYGWCSYVMDFLGSWFFDAPVTEDLKHQLTNQLPQLTSAWGKDAPILFKELFSTFQKGIKAENRNALINLSHGSSYGSHRFLIFGLRWFLDPEPWRFAISKEDAFSALVFHELLHVWVDENLHKDRSELLQKYRDEDSLVLDHLHLMAIQKMIYLKINRPDLLDFIDESYRTNQGPLYKKAWEIVNNIEGYESVLADIIL